MRLSDITPGTLYASPTGTYVATAAQHVGAYVPVSLEPNGHSGAPLTVRFLSGAESADWTR